MVKAFQFSHPECVFGSLQKPMRLLERKWLLFSSFSSLISVPLSFSSRGWKSHDNEQLYIQTER
jgi:hypothetical protein